MLTITEFVVESADSNTAIELTYSTTETTTDPANISSCVYGP